MRLHVLGSGSPEPYARRASSGYLVELGATKIMLDCGGGAVSRLLEAGFAPDEVDYLFLSHLHSDHMLDYARLIHAAWDMSGKRIRVFGPPPLSLIHQRLFGPDGAFAFDLAARTDFAPSQEVWRARGGVVPRPWPAPEINEVVPGFVHDGGEWQLSSCEVPHAQPHLACMAFRIEANGRSLVYSGDAGLCSGMEKLAREADLLIHWCYRADGQHVHPALDALSPTPSDIASFAKRVGVKRLRITHIRVSMDTDAERSPALAALKTQFGEEAGIAEDLDVYDV